MRIEKYLCALLLAGVTAILVLGGCGGAGSGSVNQSGNGIRGKASEGKLKEWLRQAELDDHFTKEQLYEAALSEGTLVVYSVSGRAFQAKEAFEKEYPGLSVEVKDIRSGDVVDMLKKNYETEDYACDVVICSDCDGSLYKELIEPGIIFSYVPWDIAPHVKEGCADVELYFLGEIMMPFYNTAVFDRQPIDNIWELTEERFLGKIMMSSPLSSFSTYGFCAQVLHEEEALAQAYQKYAGHPLEVPEGKTAGRIFWEMLGENICFVNSNDEALEGVGNSEDAWIGIVISSKLRYQSLGYHFEPITRLEPFSSVFTPNCIELAGGAENINTAKLFIRYIMGETDGNAQGAAAFSTEGSWSTRTDMQDGSSIPMEEIDVIRMDKNYLYENRQMLTEFFGSLLEENINLEE